MKLTHSIDVHSFNREIGGFEPVLVIEPELPENFDGDMQWDLDDIMFLLKMQGAYPVMFGNNVLTFSYEDVNYNIDGYDAYDLSVGKSVDVYRSCWQ